MPRKKKGANPETKRSRAEARAENLKQVIPTINGDTPQPCELEHPITSLEYLDSARDLDCPRYERCLDVAAIADWKSLTCRACPAFVRNRNGNYIRNIVRPMFRIIRKVFYGEKE